MVTFYIIGAALVLILLLIEFFFTDHFKGWSRQEQNTKIFEVGLSLIIIAFSWITIFVIILIKIRESYEQK